MPCTKLRGVPTLAGLTLLLLLLLPYRAALAVPSFSRQTGVTCASCHTIFPQLTPFGRNFKLHGYTMIAGAQGETNRLEEGAFPPISVMIQSSYSALDRQTPGAQNGNAVLPEQLSLFYSGRISAVLGAFTQITYDGTEDHFSMDNVDVRLALSAGGPSPGIGYGLVLNNNPTVSDIYNSTPAWGFPYTASGSTPDPTASAQVDGELGQEVTGLGAWGSWGERVYAQTNLYRSFQIGDEFPPVQDSDGVIHGVTPFWRVALAVQRGEQNLEVGTYGLWSKQSQGAGGVGDPPPGTNKFTDYAFDLQYQWLRSKHTLTVHSTWIHEKQKWDAAYPVGSTSNPSDVLKTFRADVTYYYRRLIGASLGWFDTSGDTDRLLYPAAPVEGSRTGSPDTRGLITEIAYVPWYNTKISAHYTIYDRFNGSAENYDGSGRDASDNNTLYLNIWLMF